jgi:hypothetical protein
MRGTTLTITDEAAAPPAVTPPRGTPHLNAALAAAQAEMPPIVKGETGEVAGVTKEGRPFAYKYTYADLGALTAVAYPILGKHGLSFSSQPALTERGFILKYQLRHESGEEISERMPLPAAAKPQDLGKLLTYYKRYVFMAVTGITPGGEDDDAQSVNTEQRFDRSERSAGEAFENARPAEPRRQQQSQQRPPVTVPPLEDGDDWKQKIEDIADAQEGAAVRAEVAELLETGAIDQERASRLNAVITVKGLALVAAQGRPRPGRAEAAPPIRPEDQGARKPEQAAAADDADWVTEFSARLAEAGEDDLGAMQREVGRAVADRKIQADTAGELAAAIRVRRNSLSASVPA